MVACKNCHDTHTVKNGFVRDKQRDKCKLCGYKFVLGDERHSQATEVKKALGILLDSLGKASCGVLAKLVGVSRTTTSDWIRQAAARTDEPTMAPDMRAIEVDAMRHLIRSKNETSGLSKPWIVAPGEPLPGYAVVVMRQHANGSLRNSNIEQRLYATRTTGTPLPRSCRKSGLSRATPRRLPLHEIIRIRAITWPGCHVEPRWSLTQQTCFMHP
jgi:transposase